MPHKDPEAAKAFRRAYYQRPDIRAKALEYYRTPKGKAAVRRYQLKSQFGITPEEYDAILLTQGGGCFICHRKDGGYVRNGRIARLAVDHDHETGMVRGILCKQCNQLLGMANDDPEILRAAIVYLEHMKVARVLR